MLRPFCTLAPVVRRCLFIPVLFAALSAAAAEGVDTLAPDDAARFVASLPGMMAIRDDLRRDVQSIESGDDPLLPFRAVAEDSPVRVRIENHLATHGFSSLSDWQDTGKPLMEAYWTLSARSRHAMLADQMAPLALAVRGVKSPTGLDLARMADKLYDDMRQRSRARVPEENMALAIEYQKRIAHSLSPATETTQ